MKHSIYFIISIVIFTGCSSSEDISSSFSKRKYCKGFFNNSTQSAEHTLLNGQILNNKLEYSSCSGKKDLGNVIKRYKEIPKLDNNAKLKSNFNQNVKTNILSVPKKVAIYCQNTCTKNIYSDNESTPAVDSSKLVYSKVSLIVGVLVYLINALFHLSPWFLLGYILIVASTILLIYLTKKEEKHTPVLGALAVLSTVLTILCFAGSINSSGETFALGAGVFSLVGIVFSVLSLFNKGEKHFLATVSLYLCLLFAAIALSVVK